MMAPHGVAVLHGIPNCDTVKRARAWLAEQGVDYRFHDFKKAGVPAEALARWAEVVGWEKLLNRQGTTWRKLPQAEKAAVLDAAPASRLMQAQASVIKRPVVDWGDGAVTVGFDAADWAQRLG